jgi:adenylate cyclase
MSNELRLKQLELETLLEITNTLLEFENVKELLQEILDRACSILDASCGFILTEDKASELLVPRVTFNINDEILHSIIFNAKRGFLSKLNHISDPKGYVEMDPITLNKLNKEYSIVAPLKDKKRVIGAIILLDKELRTGKSAFTSNDSSMLAAIAAQASVAYSNTALLDTLIESRRFNTSVMESIHTGVITTNLFGEVDLINQAALGILKTNREDVEGNHYEIVFENNKQLIDLLQRVESDSVRLKESNYPLRVNQEDTTVNLSISPLIDEEKGNIGLVIALEDISHLDKIKSTFKRYVSKQIVDQILENEDHLNLGGQELEVTTLFSDIRGFTSMSEKMSPKDVVDSLNEYFDKMIEVVFKHNGTLDKIIGDALMVIYGAPIGSSNDAERALLTAIEMQQKLEELNLLRKIRGQSPLEIGIGLNTGKVISGNIGSKVQMNYTVIGDAVNLSSRLCSFANAGQIIVSESVYSALKNKSNFAFKELSPIMVKGKEKHVSVFEVPYFKNDLFSSVEEKYQQIEQFLINNLPSHLVYHSIDHVKDVVEKSESYGISEKLSEHKMHLLKTAAWLHDIGYIWDDKSHEERGCQFAKEFLPEWGFSIDEIDTICGMIMATKIPQSPNTLLEQIICDADLDYLGREDYFIISERLLEELKNSRELSPSEWKKIQLAFFNKHQYFTGSAKSMRSKGKQINAEKIANKK